MEISVRTRVLMVSLGLLLGWLLPGCVHQNAPSRHAWYREAPREAFSGASRISSSDVLAVSEENVAITVEKLITSPAIRLTSAEAERLSGREVSSDHDYILLRGLCTGCGTGTFFVLVGAGWIIVDNISLAARDTPPTAWPVIVKTPHMPRHVYVQYGTAE
jgi:hypothetical protein